VKYLYGPTKQSLFDRADKLLYATPFGKWVGVEDFAFLMYMLSYHEDSHHKLRKTVMAITVSMDEHYKDGKKKGGKRFEIIYTDSTSQCFSYRGCLSPSTFRTQLSAACREAVRDQTQSFGYQWLQQGLPCAISGEPLVRGEFIVHHDPEFSILVENWAQPELCEKIQAVGLVKRVVEGHDKGGKDLPEPHRSHWRAYHQQHARLFVITEEVHKELHKKRR